jgi:hypothetical protein
MGKWKDRITTLSTEVDAEIEIYFEDVEDFVRQCDSSQQKKLLDVISVSSNSEIITYDNLYDREKFLILKELSNLPLQTLEKIKNESWEKK